MIITLSIEHAEYLIDCILAFSEGDGGKINSHLWNALKCGIEFDKEKQRTWVYKPSNEDILETIKEKYPQASAYITYMKDFQ
jgi:hypothetical protein